MTSCLCNSRQVIHTDMCLTVYQNCRASCCIRLLCIKSTTLHTPPSSHCSQWDFSNNWLNRLSRRYCFCTINLQLIVTGSVSANGFHCYANDAIMLQGARKDTEEAWQKEKARQKRKKEGGRGGSKAGQEHLADIVEVSVRCGLLGQELLVSIEHDMQVELLLQQHEAMVAEALDGAHGRDLAHPAPPCNRARPGDDTIIRINQLHNRP